MFNQKNKVMRADYEQWRAGQDETAARIASDPDRLLFHVEPELGWLNDPNGLVQIGDTYHIYHQYDPFDAAHGGPVIWNHLTTKDFVTYENRGPVLFPDSDLDSSGAYSGSAFVRDGKIHYFYTGNVKHFDRDDYDYVLTGREQNQIHVVAENPDELGEKFGFMWECPDLFELDGELILVCCPQGVSADGWRYRNPHQCVWFPIEADWEAPSFKIAGQGMPPMVDAGFDFYAPQSFEDAAGRRLMIGWSGCPDATAKSPTVARGWQCALTVPRELSMRDGKLCQQPVHEIERMRGDCVRAIGGETVEEPGRLFDLVVSCEGAKMVELEIRKGVFVRYADGMLTLDMGDEGYGRDQRSIELSELRDLRVLSDTTMVEIFANGGEAALTSRTYSPAVPAMGLHAEGAASMDFYRLAH